MGVATDVLTHIDASIVNYAAEKSSAIMAIISPAVASGMGIFVMFQGYRHMMGQVEQPFTAFIDIIVKMVAIVGVALTAGTYNDLIIPTFQDSPAALAAAMSGATGGATLTGSIGASLDQAFFDCYEITKSFWDQPGWNIDGYIIGFLVLVAGLAITLYTGFLVVLSKIASALLLAIGPVFIAGLLFDKTKGFFGSYLSALFNNGWIIVLAVGANSLILSMFWNAASDVNALGSTATFLDVLTMLFAGGIGFLVLWQVPSLAASLSGGVSMDTFGIGRMAAAAASKGVNRATGGQRRENQKAAKNSLDIEKRKEKLVARNAPRKKKGGEVSQSTGTNG